MARGDFVVGASGTTGVRQTPCSGTLAFLRLTDQGKPSTDATGATRSFCSWNGVWKEQWTIRTKDGAYVMAGWQQDVGNPPPNDVLVVKFAADGTFSWGKAFNNTGTNYHDDTADFISETPDGGFAVAGTTMVGSDPSQGNYNALMFRLDKSGNIEWQGTWGNMNSKSTFSTAMLESEDERSFIVTGRESSPDHVGDLYSGLLLKLDWNGKALAQKKFVSDLTLTGAPGAGDWLWLAIPRMNGFLISGTTQSVFPPKVPYKTTNNPVAIKIGAHADWGTMCSRNISDVSKDYSGTPSFTTVPLTERKRCNVKCSNGQDLCPYDGGQAGPCFTDITSSVSTQNLMFR
jgi:hypothetical protein